MKRILLLALLISTATFGVSAQENSRQVIRDGIKATGKCYNVAITKTKGDAALFGYWCEISNCADLASEYYDMEETAVMASFYFDDDISYDYKDITITESGEWLILADDRIFEYSSGIPSRLKDKLKEYYGSNQKFNSISFNDKGDWIVITQEYFSSSSTELQEWLKEGRENYGVIWTAFINDDGAVAVYEKGIRYRGNVPQALKDALSDTTINSYFVKFAGTSWFFADKNGTYKYSM